MAEKPSDEYPHDNTDNTDNTSEASTSSNSKDDQKGDDTPVTICTLSHDFRRMSEMFPWFENQYFELHTFKSYSPYFPMPKFVGSFFDENICDKYKNHGNGNNDGHFPDLFNIRIKVNDEPRIYSAKIVKNKMSVTYKTTVDLQDLSNIFFTYKKFPRYLLSLEAPVMDCTADLPLSDTLNPQLNIDVNFVKQGQEYIDFLSVFTEFDFCKPFIEKIFSYLSYRDIASMTTVSKTWRNAVLQSVNAQKELEKVFIHAILYFCHKNTNVTDEYKQLYDKILIHFKNQIQFKKHDV